MPPDSCHLSLFGITVQLKHLIFKLCLYKLVILKFIPYTLLPEYYLNYMLYYMARAIVGLGHISLIMKLSFKYSYYDYLNDKLHSS